MAYDIFTLVSNLSGQPSIALPHSLQAQETTAVDGSRQTLDSPFSVQLMAPHHADRKLLAFAQQCEDIFGFSKNQRAL